MKSHVEHMKALKATWERAPTGPNKNAALKNYEAALKTSIARIERAAIIHLRKAEARRSAPGFHYVLPAQSPGRWLTPATPVPDHVLPLGANAICR